jgi:hypothetical protein
MDVPFRSMNERFSRGHASRRGRRIRPSRRQSYGGERLVRSVRRERVRLRGFSSFVARSVRFVTDYSGAHLN